MSATTRAGGSVRACALATALSLLAAGCTVGPDYVKPDAPAPAAYKEMPPAKTAEPADLVPRGSWWAVYGDATLDALILQVPAANQSLRAAEANYRQAQAAVFAARAGLYPSVGANVSATRTRQGSGSASGINSGNNSGSNTFYTLSLPVDWEIDLWGKIRRAVESSEDSAQASAADLAATRLSLETQLAQTYFALRVADRSKRLSDDTVAAYKKTVTLTQNRYDSGVAARSDVVFAETQLQTAQVQAVDIGLTRALLEHAIAVLIGKPPADFSLPPVEVVPGLPPIPAAVPSALLERRPDIAAAERRVAAANAQIGVATAAFYPDLSLSGSFGLASSSLSNWISLPNRIWSLGAALVTPLFDAGLRKAQRDEAVAAYDATVANYRQTVLSGFQDVEDNLATLRILEEEAVAQEIALASARKSVEITTNQYRAGIVNYISVVAAQAIAFSAEQNAVNLNGRRLAASVGLIKALGGGWQAADLPTTAR
jgi:NodT family efflux transporter outer membrane factor (OMF) lipoprotein